MPPRYRRRCKLLHKAVYECHIRKEAELTLRLLSYYRLHKFFTIHEQHIVSELLKVVILVLFADDEHIVCIINKVSIKTRAERAMVTLPIVKVAAEPRPSAQTRMIAATMRLRLFVKSTLDSTTFLTPIAEIIP